MRAVELGIHAVLVTGSCDDDVKHEFLTDFDSKTASAQIVFSTAAITVGCTFDRVFSAAHFGALVDAHADGSLYASVLGGHGDNVSMVVSEDLTLA